MIDTDLVQFEGHAHAWCNNTAQQFNVNKYPLVTHRGYPQISFEECVKTTQKEIDAVTQEEQIKKRK